MTTILTYAEAAALVLDQGRRFAAATPRRTEQLPLLDALHRVLAAPVRADRDLPPFDRSTRDGYAVRAAALTAATGCQSLESCAPAKPAPRTARSRRRTGDHDRRTRAGGRRRRRHARTRRDRAASRIRLSDGRSSAPAATSCPPAAKPAPAIRSSPPAHASPPPTSQPSPQSASLDVEVFARPALPSSPPATSWWKSPPPRSPHQIRNSNSYHAGRAGRRSPAESPFASASPAISLDDLEPLLDAAQQSSDLLLLSGGVSAGKFDLVEPALAQRGAIFHFTGVRIQPGKPTVFGELAPRPAASASLPFFGLPGNPVSTMVTFLLFAAPVLRALAGEASPAPRFAQARLAAAEIAADITRFLPATLTPAGTTPPSVASRGKAPATSLPWPSPTASWSSRPTTAIEAGATVQSCCRSPTTLDAMAKKSKSKLSHFDKSGRARMVDVSAKPATRREATASAFVELSKAVLKAMPESPKAIRSKWLASPASRPQRRPRS